MSIDQVTYYLESTVMIHLIWQEMHFVVYEVISLSMHDNQFVIENKYLANMAVKQKNTIYMQSNFCLG